MQGESRSFTLTNKTNYDEITSSLTEHAAQVIIITVILY